MPIRANVFTFGLATLAGVHPCVLAQDYAVINLGGSTSATAVNQHGWVTGGRGESAFLWRNGEFEIRPRQGGGCCSFANAINDHGDIAGLQGQIFNENAAMWLEDGTLIDIGKVAPPKAVAKAINSDRTVVGWTYIPGPDTSGFVWKDGEFTIIPSFTSEDPGSGATAINELGQVVGTAAYRLGGGQAYLWDGKKLTGLGVLEEGRSSLGKDINNHTQVVGYASVFILDHAFIWENGQMFDINDDNIANSTYAFAINDEEVIVGSMLTRGTYLDLACIWRNRQLSDLNESLPVNSQWTLIEAWDINNFGQIVGNGKYRGQNNHGFMLTPVTPTMALEQPSPGRADAINTLTVTGCDPGKRVYFTYSRRGGGTIIPGCDLQENALQLDQPTVIGSTIADENGRASITKFVPGNARNLGDILIQALQQNGCKISQMVVEEFE